MSQEAPLQDEGTGTPEWNAAKWMVICCICVGQVKTSAVRKKKKKCVVIYKSLGFIALRLVEFIY